MSSVPRYVATLGQPAVKDDLRSRRAKQFLEFVEAAGASCYARVVELRVLPEHNLDVIVFDTEVERSRILTYSILKIERIQVAFFLDDAKPPEVHALREDFPTCPHIMLTRTALPRQLCLYEQSWEDVRLNWNAANFLSRIRFWLAKTATGTLHADDQPLEPLIIPGGSRLILPSDFSVEKVKGQLGLLSIYLLNHIGDSYTFAAYWEDRDATRNKKSAAAIFECQPQQHGVMKHQPANLAELHELCVAAGLDLATELARKVQEWHAQKPDSKILAAQLVIILLLPKIRTGTVVEKVDVCAFLTGLSIEQVGQKLGVIQRHDGIAGYILGGPKADLSALTPIEVGMLQVVPSLNAESAAKLNNAEPYRERICAVGMGAIGSQIFNNLLRSGFGSWTVIDNDVLLPHNCARHFLGDWAIGQSKAQAMVDVATTILDDDNAAKALHENVLNLGAGSGEVQDALKKADLILDLSASVAVSRHLAHSELSGRVASAYMAPKGDSLIIAVEDKERKVRLDWLEMLHYRAVLNVPELADSYHVDDAQVRYGNSCRDLSLRLAQDDVALWAAIASKCIKTLPKSAEPCLRVYRSTQTGEVSMFESKISTQFLAVLKTWTLIFDEELILRLSRLRQERLPNETGGVLVGHFDTMHHFCYIVEAIPSPPDSVEWPVSYIRGWEGLTARVRDVQKNTLDQLTYVGEWHSHPEGCSTSPSEDDFKAYGWIAAQMGIEGLPAIMLIIGQNQAFTFVSSL